MTESLQSWLGVGSRAALWTEIGAALLLLGGLIGVWLIFGRGPRRRRAVRRAQRLLQHGNWQQALGQVEAARQFGRLSPNWKQRLDRLEGECQRAASKNALADNRYEDGLQHLLTSSRLLKLDEAEARNFVVGVMLSEVRRLFATSSGPDTAAIQQLISRVLNLELSSPEASFWQALCLVREGNFGQALTALHQAQQFADKFLLDPPLYLGALHLQQGRYPEALRYLSEANRLEAGCPFVGWQLGLALHLAGGDAGLAVRALQRALGPQGMPRWIKQPERAWVEGMPPPARCFVRRLADQHPFQCPVLGSDVAAMVRQGQLALAQCQYRLGNYQESAAVFQSLLQEAAPTVTVLRGLGLALARLEQYDEAFKHLRTAHEQENPKNHLTAGYLALCGALGKPTRPEDRPNNLSWAIRLLGRFKVHGDAEWAGITNTVFAEARTLGLPVPADELQRLGDVLASVDAADARAAAAYDHMFAAAPTSIRPEHAWLYCRAAQQHDYRGAHDLDLFARAFQEAAPARGFFQQRDWDFDAVEVTYLQRWVEQYPGRFPDVLGTEYAVQGERLLLERSRQQERARRPDDALASAALLQRLAPHSPAAFDRLAQLHYRRGELDQAIRCLNEWHAAHPRDYWPLARRSIIEHQRGNASASAAALQQALKLTQGAARTKTAFLGARLALANGQHDEATGLLALCLQDDPGHVDALWCLAALRNLAGAQTDLIALAPAMSRPEVREGRYHYLAGICHLAANALPQALEASQRAAQDDALTVESKYLSGIIHLRRQVLPAAATDLQQVALTANSPSTDHARALLGRIQFIQGAYDEAIAWWQLLDAQKRKDWHFDEPLRATLFLSGLRAYTEGRYQPASEKFREAGRAGWRDRRLAGLLTLSLFKAGQWLLYQGGQENGQKDTLTTDPSTLLTSSYEGAAHLLEQVVKAGSKDAAAAYLLALAYKRLGNWREARTALRKIATPDANVWLQMGLLSLWEKQLGQAAQEFERAWQMDPTSYEAGYNLLLTRLSLGEIDASAALVPRVIELAQQSSEEQRQFMLLRSLLQSFQTTQRDARFDSWLTEMTAEQEQRLLDLLRALGQMDTIRTLLKALLDARPQSQAVRVAYLEAALLKAKQSLDRCDWLAAERLLAPLAREKSLPRPAQAALLNLLGCSACLCQDTAGGVRHFTAAVTLNPQDARIQQNTALAHEWVQDLAHADPHWNRFFKLLDERWPVPPNQPNYIQRLAHDAMCRLATTYNDQQRPIDGVPYLERAHQLLPENIDTLERLFHLYNQAKRPQEAQRVLARLKQMRPGEPQFDLYELDVHEVRDVSDIERVVTEIGRILQVHPNDPRVEDRAVHMVGNVLPLMGRLCDQLTDQLNKVMSQVRSLPNYQIKWEAVHEIMRELKREFLKLKRITSKCMPLAMLSDHRRMIHELSEHIDRKIEFCQRWEGR